MARRPPSTPATSPVDEVYSGPLGEFIPRRKALAGQLKREGRADEAARVAALAKPSQSAWAVNQVYWHARDLWDALLAAGDMLRKLQQRMLAGHAADPREAMAERQTAARAVVDRAMEFLRDHGSAATEATKQRVVVTVDAIAAYGSDTDAYTPGRLTTDLDPPGFAALASLDAPALRLVKGGAHPRPAPEPRPTEKAAPKREQPVRTAAERREEARARETERRRERDALKAQVEEAADDEAAAKRDLDRAARHARLLQGEAKDVAKQVEAAREALTRLERRLEEAQRTAHEAEEAEDAAAKRLDEASARLAAARAALKGLR